MGIDPSAALGTTVSDRRFWAKNAGGKAQFWEGTLIFGAKIRVGVLEKCLNV